VVSLGYIDQDAILALGIVPVEIRESTGNQPSARAHLRGEHSQVLPVSGIGPETLAGLRPDLIVAVSAGLTKEDYDLYSRVAPVLAQPAVRGLRQTMAGGDPPDRPGGLLDQSDVVALITAGAAEAHRLHRIARIRPAESGAWSAARHVRRPGACSALVLERAEPAAAPRGGAGEARRRVDGAGTPGRLSRRTA
jgi:hypothetical protein